MGPNKKKTNIFQGRNHYVNPCHTPSPGHQESAFMAKVPAIRARRCISSARVTWGRMKRRRSDTHRTRRAVTYTRGIPLGSRGNLLRLFIGLFYHTIRSLFTNKIFIVTSRDLEGPWNTFQRETVGGGDNGVMVLYIYTFIVLYMRISNGSHRIQGHASEWIANSMRLDIRSPPLPPCHYPPLPLHLFSA